ncbi:MAG: pteridine reductase [Xanthomonadales bacterium]|nr:pteridine reductase [Xanthomonadales bacterium]
MDQEQPRVALITGAARRVGADIARRLHAAGWNLALHYRRGGDAMTRLLAELNAARADSAAAWPAELAEFDRLPELVALAVGRFGQLDALVNNASAFYPTSVGSITPDQWDDLFAANARAPLFLCQAAAPHLRARGGAIVNLVDIYAERPLAGHTVYCMAKAALVMATRSLAIELGPDIRVNAVAPGAVLWPESGKDYADQQQLVASTALKCSGSPGDVAEAVRWLLEDAHHCSGEIIRVDGGRHLNM